MFQSAHLERTPIISLSPVGSSCVKELFRSNCQFTNVSEFREIAFSIFTLCPFHNSIWVFILWRLGLETSPRNAFGDIMKLASPFGLDGVPGKKSLQNFLTKTSFGVTKLSPKLVEQQPLNIQVRTDLELNQPTNSNFMALPAFS